MWYQSFKFFTVSPKINFLVDTFVNSIPDGHFLCCYQATLLLPASPVMPFENVDRAYLEDHVAFSQSSEDGTKVITLNGVRGFIQQ